ncbi:glutaredoxin 2 [Cysteiniphilum sp. QT6929]|uniref:glutaredoxin 2 n=1 Tax=Cysteiniphilum sp. QT6929 TaxID=2975055 RepID=UPI0024B355B7|nr:glutaredoxin 2 [Cysteiniphilum sp. QT6929]WHN64632.1 glutaredoxin 2 [Cysteiniphilum sp. QT6929]
MKLYIYEHCPFCIRPRIISGLKQIPLELIYLANDDEKSHIDLIGKKQVPFLQKDDDSFLVESLDICQYLNNFDNKPILSDEITTSTKLIELTTMLSNASKSLVYPSFLNHPLNQQDFPTQSAKDYFERKKEKYIGCFKANLRFPDAAIESTQAILNELDKLMTHTYASSNHVSWDDIMVFPILRNLGIISHLINIPENIKRYVKHLAHEADIELYTNFKQG